MAPSVWSFRKIIKGRKFQLDLNILKTVINPELNFHRHLANFYLCLDRWNPTLRSSWVALLLSGILSVTVITNASGEEKDFPEAKIKAAYLYNFLRFIEWPDDVEASNHICIVGHNGEFRGAVGSLRNLSINEHPIIIKFAEDLNLQGLGNCKIIFVTAGANRRQKMIANIIRNKSILTVGESRGFADQRGIINFVKENDKIRFEINLTAANKASIRIPSKILRIATRVIE